LPGFCLENNRLWLKSSNAASTAQRSFNRTSSDRRGLERHRDPNASFAPFQT
jgi:hypothetical protein